MRCPSRRSCAAVSQAPQRHELSSQRPGKESPSIDQCHPISTANTAQATVSDTPACSRVVVGGRVGNDRDVLEIPPLPTSTILLVEIGSTAHGTGLPGGEDHDKVRVVVETPRVLGLDHLGFAA